MPKYLIEASYAPEGAQGILKEGGSRRRDTIAKLVQDLGGTMESFYFGFGEHDAYVTVELPDNVSAATIALQVNSSGAVQAKTIVLLTPEEVDEATKKTVKYRPPGG